MFPVSLKLARDLSVNKYVNESDVGEQNIEIQKSNQKKINLQACIIGRDHNLSPNFHVPFLFSRKVIK